MSIVFCVCVQGWEIWKISFARNYWNDGKRAFTLTRKRRDSIQTVREEKKNKRKLHIQLELASSGYTERGKKNHETLYEEDFMLGKIV